MESTASDTRINPESHPRLHAQSASGHFTNFTEISYGKTPVRYDQCEMHESRRSQTNPPSLK